MTTTETQLNHIIEETLKALDTVTVNGSVKPVALAQIVGVREQMVYNYIKDGRIKGHRNAGGYHRVKADIAKTWAKEYLTRKYNKDA